MGCLYSQIAYSSFDKVSGSLFRDFTLKTGKNSGTGSRITCLCVHSGVSVSAHYFKSTSTAGVCAGGGGRYLQAKELPCKEMVSLEERTICMNCYMRFVKYMTKQR